MKRIYTILLTAALVACTGGCTRILDVAPDGRLDYAQIFADNEKVAAYLNTCYSFVPSKGFWYYFSTSVPAALSDEAWDADDCVGLRVVQYYNGNVSAGGNPLYEDMPATNKRLGTYWRYYWEAIRNCTVFLDHIGNATVANESDRDRWRAEAHVLRAYYHFELLKWYGASFPVNRDLYDLEQDYSTLRQASYGDIVKFIEEDCDRALASDGLPWRITTEAEIMRVTKAVAECIKSKAVLYAVSERFYDENGHYTKEEAYRINVQSLQNLRDNGYELFNRNNDFAVPEIYTAPYADVFAGARSAEMINAAGANKYYFSNWADYSANPTDKETIWQHQVKQDRLWLLTTWLGKYKCGPCPTQEFVDAHEVTDGTVAYNILDLEQPYLDEQHLRPNFNPAAAALYDENDPYRNRDPRFYATIYYNGAKRYIEESQSWKTVWTDVDDQESGLRNGSIGDHRAFTRTGYYTQKFLHPTEGPHDPTYYSPGWKLFRLGEIILNVAELAVEAGHPEEAAPLLNEIRRRSAMPEIPAQYHADADKMRQLVRQERRIELGYEEARYFDVRRWTPKGDGYDLSATDRWLTKMVITDTSADRDHSSHSFERQNVRPAERDCYKSKYLLQPIPLNEASRLENITGLKWQNPGW